MNHEPLNTFINEHYDDYVGLFIDIMKFELHTKHKRLFDLMDFEDDSSWIAPFLQTKQAQNNLPEIPTIQLLYGNIPKEKRPNEIPVYSDYQGMVYIPNIGYFQSEEKKQKLTFTVSNEGDYTLTNDGTTIPFKYTPITTYKDTPLEIVQYDNNVIRWHYNHDKETRVIDIPNAFQDHKENLSLALDLLEDVNHLFFTRVINVIRRFVVFYNQDVRSFAANNAIGASFFSARKEYNEISFLEDIVHQCSHNLLFIITLQTKEFFRINPKERMINEFNNNPEDGRLVYSAFHGTFSLLNIVSTFSHMLNKEFEDVHKTHEVKGRFYDNLDRLKSRIEKIKYKEIYTERGWKFLNLMEDSTNKIYNEHKEVLATQDFTDRPYVFDYNYYLKLNPIG